MFTSETKKLSEISVTLPDNYDFSDLQSNYIKYFRNVNEALKNCWGIDKNKQSIQEERKAMKVIKYGILLAERIQLDSNDQQSHTNAWPFINRVVALNFGIECLNHAEYHLDSMHLNNSFQSPTDRAQAYTDINLQINQCRKKLNNILKTVVASKINLLDQEFESNKNSIEEKQTLIPDFYETIDCILQSTKLEFNIHQLFPLLHVLFINLHKNNYRRPEKICIDEKNTFIFDEEYNLTTNINRIVMALLLCKIIAGTQSDQPNYPAISVLFKEVKQALKEADFCAPLFSTVSCSGIQR